ncbi:MAG TPA: Gfo/Idh/MocA family oxidoreductase [Phycisphaerae bacterium]|nr:Gfo/Idh/MocA family oxidoreductase [Phycisphaerae bacterium]
MISNPKILGDRVRFAVVGLGWIAQEDVLPAFTLRGRHFELVALVSGDEKKREELGKKYGIQRVLGYEGYDDLLAGTDIDAVYIALPNRMHAEYAVKAAKAGIHVLCEKPMAMSERECQDMIHAAEESGVKLMIAYRLHFEEANMAAVELIKSGKIGEPRFFSCAFAQQVKEGNNRLDRREGYGPVMDMGVYPINAARYLFRSEPTSVVALSESLAGDARWKEVPEMTSVVMRFPDERLAQFTVCFNGGDVGSYTVVGTKGSVKLEPAFSYAQEITMTTKIDGKEEKRSFRRSQQFGAEIEYFAKAILDDTDIEPNGLEGLADMRVVWAIEKSAEAKGRLEEIEPVGKMLRPGADQVIRMKPRQEETLVDAKPPEEG